MEIAANVGIETGYSENTSMQDVVTITDNLFVSTKDITLPENDTVPTPEGLIGKRLYDKTAVNMEKWNLVIEYDTSNKEKARYGSGYYLLEPGTYTINGEVVSYKRFITTGKLQGVSTYKIKLSKPLSEGESK